MAKVGSKDDHQQAVSDLNNPKVHDHGPPAVSRLYTAIID